MLVTGDSVTMTASANTGYKFSQWEDGNTDNPRTVIVVGSMTYTALYTTVQTYTIYALSNNDDYGTVTGGGTYNSGAKATLTATPKSGYKFVKWNDDNTSATRTITVSATAAYVATFEPLISATATYIAGYSEGTSATAYIAVTPSATPTSCGGSVSGATCSLAGAYNGANYIVKVSGLTAGSSYTFYPVVNGSTMSTSLNFTAPASNVASSGYASRVADGTAFKVNGARVDVHGAGGVKTTYANAGWTTLTSSGVDVFPIPSIVSTNGRDYVNLKYIVRKSTPSASVSSARVGINADIMIGSNDRAPVYKMEYGLRTAASTAANALSFAILTQKGTDGLAAQIEKTASSRWFGYWSYRSANTFVNTSATSLSGIDSGAAVSWQNLDLSSGAPQTVNVIIGVADKLDVDTDAKGDGTLESDPGTVTPSADVEVTPPTVPTITRDGTTVTVSPTVTGLTYTLYDEAGNELGTATGTGEAIQFTGIAVDKAISLSVVDPTTGAESHVSSPASDSKVKVGDGSYYASIEDAIADATGGETIQLLDDMTGTLTIPAGANLTLDLNGHSIDGGTECGVTNGPVIAVASGAVFTLKDTVGTGVIKNGFAGTGKIGGGAVCNCGTFTFESGIISNCYAAGYLDGGTCWNGEGGAICNDGSASVFKMTGGTIIDCGAPVGGAIAVSDGAVGTITGGLVTNCTTIGMLDGWTGIGGAVMNKNELVIDGGVFAGNSAIYGGVIDNRASLIVSNGTFAANTGYNLGGAIRSLGSTEILGGTFTDNVSTNRGGAIYLGADIEPDPVIENATFVGNSADNGGAVLCQVDCLIRNCLFEENYASDRGGAISTYYALEVSNTVISANDADGYGGGICTQDQLTLDEGTVITNNSSYYGGGICQLVGGFTMTNGVTITGNSGSYGGGIFAYTDTTLEIDGGEVTDNEAYYGGGICNWQGEVNIDGGSINANYSYYSGGGVYNYYGYVYLYRGEIDDNYAKYGHGGAVYNSGLVYVAGGEISGNYAAGSGGGICNVNLCELFAGDVSGNYSGSHQYNDNVYVAADTTLYLRYYPKCSSVYLDGATAAVQVLGAMSTATDIGFYSASGARVLTSGWGAKSGDPDWTQMFTSLNGSPFYIKPTPDGSELELTYDYTVTFDANGGSGTLATQTKQYGDNQSLSSNTLSRTYYTFNGWNTAADGSGTSYDDAEACEFGDAAATGGTAFTLYAQWVINVPYYTVEYLANGGEGEVKTDEAVFNATYTIAANEFTQDGYTFGGWATNATGSAVYEAGQKVFNLGAADATVSLYAVWIEDSSKHPGDIEENIEAETAELAKEAVTIAIPEPTKFTEKGITGAKETAYLEMFEKKVTGEAGNYTVEIVLTKEAEEQVQQSVDEAVKKLAEELSTKAFKTNHDRQFKLDIDDAVPGIYYSVESTATLDNPEWSASTSERVLCDGEGKFTVTLPFKGDPETTDSQHYRFKADLQGKVKSKGEK